LALLLTALGASVAEASRVTPMIVEMKPTGRQAVARIELTNDSGRDIAYEVAMVRGEISTKGELTVTPADDDFLVFPPQALVERDSSQVFRVQYLGTDLLETSQLYYLAIRQVPVAFDPGENQVQVIVNFNVLVHVVPDNTEPLPQVISAQYVEREVLEGDGPAEDGAAPRMEKGLLVELGNNGTRYYYAGQSKWTIRATTMSGEPYVMQLTGDDASRFVGAGVVAPGRNREFFLPSDAPLRPESILVELDL
ncbi:MAG: fimbria/pilus periplasmic chaperone, partial [Pseudomonadota bacterium]